MNHPRSAHRKTPLLLGALLVAVMLFGGLLLVAAQETDGRINTVEHVGGAAVYCVDQNFAPASDWHNGGIRVLDADGQVLLFAPADEIIVAGDPPEETLMVGEGANPFGPLTLYFRPDSKFQLNGTDEHGKAFLFVWLDCGSLPQPGVPAVNSSVTPAPTIEMSPTPTCEPVDINGRSVQLQQIQPTDDPCIIPS
jgi:hypothetical protein